MLRENRSSRSINRFPELPQVTFTKEDVHQNAALFECIAFKVVGFFMAIFCDPFGQPDRVAIPPPLAQWLPESQFVLRNGCSVLARPKLNYHPFQHAASHDKACEGNLSAEVVTLLKTLRPGGALWLCCGGDAPLEYILIAWNEDNAVEVRFMDAKHSSKVCDFPTAVREEMQRAAEMVHTGLMKELPKHLTGMAATSFVSDHLLIIRNVDESRDNLSPATFQWQPWSSLMFLERTRPLPFLSHPSLD